MKSQTDQSRARAKARAGLIKQIILLPITGGFSLFKYVRSRLLGD
jgi:hypothetical protein